MAVTKTGLLTTLTSEFSELWRGILTSIVMSRNLISDMHWSHFKHEFMIRQEKETVVKFFSVDLYVKNINLPLEEYQAAYYWHSIWHVIKWAIRRNMAAKLLCNCPIDDLGLRKQFLYLSQTLYQRIFNRKWWPFMIRVF